MSEGANTQRVIVCAAIRKDGHLICGPRHYDGVMRSQVKAWLGKFEGGWEQGFIDQYGTFLTREQAYAVAEAAGQVKYGREHSKGTLYSEDLY